tara:strand:- start:873 stop:2669 length:1797 start_codon:yes stop_codon:yes gene_type:complete
MKHIYLFILSCIVVLPSYAEEEEVEEIVSVVSSVPQKKIETNTTIDVIEKEDLKKFASTNLISILSGYLGIDTSSNGGLGQYASLFLRGSNSNHTLVKVNGIKINPSTAGGASLSNIDPSLISRIEIGSGPFSSIHGSEAIGGIINISTFPEERDSSLQLSLSRGADNYRKESLQKNWLYKSNSYNVFLLKAKSEGFPSLTSSSTDNGFNNKSLGGSYTSKKSKTQTDLSSWISKGRTEYLDFLSNPLSQDYENSIHSVNFKFKHKEPYLLYLNLATSKDLINQNQFNYINQKDTTQTDNQNVQFIVYSPPDKDFSYIVGYEQEKQKVNYSSFGSRFRKNIKTTSLFIENRIELNKSLLGINVRFSDHDSYGINKSWNIGYRTDFNQKWVFRFNSGSAFRSPNTAELYGYGSNLNLKPEISLGQEVALEKIANDSIISLVAFNNKIKDLINFDFDENILKNIAQSTNRGVEVRYMWKNKTINGRFLLRYQNPKDNLGLQLLRRSKRSLSANIYRDFSLGTLNLNLSAFGKKRDFGNLPLPKYHLFNLSFVRQLSNQMDITLRVENLFDKEYFTASGYNGYYQNQGRSLWLNATYEIRE